VEQAYIATYDPADNKLRLRATSRLDPETYARVKAAGFIWAPKQELFVAPMWTPYREDLLTELAGEIGDEDKSLVERAEERAERFEDYSDNRAKDAEQAREAVHKIADNIPLGQPILVGHHSEKHARKDAERIENGMRRAVKMWQQAEYWKDRAKGSIRLAKYKMRPDVRARRIKKLEADKRVHERNKAHAEMCLKFWQGELKFTNKETGETRTLTRETAIYFCNLHDHISREFKLAEYPRNPPASQYEGQMGFWSALGGSDGPEHAVITVEQAQAIAIPAHAATVNSCNRWIQHYENRLVYERAMLEGSGGTVADRTGPEVGGGVRCWASPGFGKGYAYIKKVNKVSVTIVKGHWAPIPFDQLRAVMTKAQVEAARADGTLLELEDKSGFYIKDKPEQTQPETQAEAAERVHREATQADEPIEAATATVDTVDNVCPDGSMCRDLKCIAERRRLGLRVIDTEVQFTRATAEDFEKLAETLKAGVKVVSAPQLFPTPPDVCERMVELAEIESGMRVLEPSAGTGNIVQAIINTDKAHPVVAIEINQQLADHLQSHFPLTFVSCCDFLSCNGSLGQFDRVLMNPPFENGADIKHIKHALTMLKPGGRLVGICANGPRQQEQIKPMTESWEVLDAGTFAGTGVTAAMFVIDKAEGNG
jgi:phospholipid N-methyltransferase